MISVVVANPLHYIIGGFYFGTLGNATAYSILPISDGGLKYFFIQMPFVNYSRLVQKVEDAIYDFEQMHPEYGLNRYSSILEANGIEWGMDSMSAKDVSVLDGKCVMAMMMGAVRAERFCDGALLGFFKKGCIKKWLQRLKEIDELESVCDRRES